MKINKSILVRGLTVCAVLLCTMLISNAFGGEAVPSDFELMEDFLVDGESHNRQLIEKGIIPVVEKDQARENVPVKYIRGSTENAEAARIHQTVEAVTIQD